MQALGGGQTGGTVVGGPSPAASILASQYQSTAAQAASDEAQAAINNALSQTNANFQAAQIGLQPTSQSGVAALDQLDQYMGIGAYNPGAAPTAPTAPTNASLEAALTPAEIKNYIYQNSGGTTNSGGQFFGNMTYSGAGSDQPYAGTPVANNEGTNSGWMGTPSGDVILNGNTSGIMNNPQMLQAIKDAIVAPQMTGANQAYQSALGQYNINQSNWQNANNLYNQYSAAGPLTQQQITSNITNLPGYQAQMNQGISAIGNNASSKGYLGSGALLKELTDYGQNTLSQFYGNELSRLAGIAAAGQQSATTIAGTQAQDNNSLAQLYTSLGDAQANGTIASGNATAQGLLSAYPQYQILGQSSTGANLGGLGSLVSAFSDFSNPTPTATA